MLDKNGVEIRTGSIVRTSGAYFKTDNALWLVTNSPGDPSWSGSDHALVKISKAGKISVSKYRVGFWPILTCTNSMSLRHDANGWNAAHAEIEVVAEGVRDWSGVRAYFQEKADGLRPLLQRHVWDWGEDSETVQKERVLLAHYEAVVASLPA